MEESNVPRKKRIAVYSPYLDTAGGGEKYMLTIAEALAAEYQVEILVDPHLESLGIEQIIKRVESLHNLNLNGVKYTLAPIGPGTSLIKRLFFLKDYDWFISNTDGSIYYSTAKNSIIHFQVPFENVSCHSLWGKIKLSSWKKAVYNSQFTKNLIESEWPIKGLVIYPPVSVEYFKPLPKKKQIVSVGRFSGARKDKKHEILIECFKELSSNNLKGWSLHIAGGASVGDKPYLEELKNLAKGFDISFYPDASLEQLKKIYGESMIYWHAKGYGEDDPKKTEHFGITTVESMAGGCVPVVINKGGQPEIVEHGKNGFLWNSLEELKELTIKVAEDDKLRKLIADNAAETSRRFSKEQFIQSIKALIEDK